MDLAGINFLQLLVLFIRKCAMNLILVGTAYFSGMGQFATMQGFIAGGGGGGGGAFTPLGEFLPPPLNF